MASKLVTSLSELAAAIDSCGLGEHAAPIHALARPCVRMRRQRVSVGSVTLQDSFFPGNFAYLPPGAMWPMAGDWAMAPLATIRLSDASRHDGSGTLPKSGLLTFWYSLQDQPWGGDPADRGAFEVTYVADESARLERRYTPGPMVHGAEPDDFWPTFKLVFAPGISLPDPHDEVDGHEEFSASPGYQDLLEAVGHMTAPNHRLLGHPFVVQTPMEEQCQFVSNGVRENETVVRTKEWQAEMDAAVADWTLLLQLDSDEGEDLNWCWGDAGLLYFWIRKQDLAAAKFDKCWQVLQCY